ncbi:hypothetical protein GCM10008931_37140 [Oceanobacillus oncorhynchi subsp. oncorhynchi]
MGERNCHNGVKHACSIDHEKTAGSGCWSDQIWHFFPTHILMDVAFSKENNKLQTGLFLQIYDIIIIDCNS